MKTIPSSAEMRATSRTWQRQGAKIGLVPTMGSLHSGHLSLVRRSREECDFTVVSLFVNPLQFNSASDLENYPRDTEEDAARLRELGVTSLYMPGEGEMYRPGFETHVVPGKLAEPLCGASRPGHFRGVTTVVAKLLQVVVPSEAYFGQKDFQQARILQRMIQDLDFDTRLRVLPTVREADGLALSSRNVHLSAAERAEAPLIYQGLREAELAYEQGERDPQHLAQVAEEMLNRGSLLRIDYLEVRDDETLDRPESLDHRGVIAAAAYLGTTRLIDNLLLGDATSRLG